MKFRAGALAIILLTLSVANERTSAQGTDQSVHPPTQQGLVPPAVLQQVKPRYTAEAMRARIQGTVRLRGVVERDGMVSNVEMVRSLDPQFGLDAGAIAALKQWRFRPGMLNGQPVRVQIIVDLSFTLSGGAATGWPEGFDPAREETGSRQEETVDAGVLRFHFRHLADWVVSERSTTTPLVLRSSDGTLTVTLLAPAPTSLRLSGPATPSQIDELSKIDAGSGSTLTATGQVDSRGRLFWVWIARRSASQQSWSFFHTQDDQLLTVRCEEQSPPAPASPAFQAAAWECSSIVNSMEVVPVAAP